MESDDNVCLCYRVPLCKLRTFMKNEKPQKASQLSECLGAGTGCGWCVPFLESLHEQHAQGQTPDLPESPEKYAERRQDYFKTGRWD